NAYPLPVGLPGGGSSLNPDGVPRALAADTIPDESPFIIISQGYTCKQAGGKSQVLPDRLQPGLTPTCQTGTELDRITLVAQANLMRETPGGGSPLRDRVLRQ